jgi:hypothetical protein
MKDPIDMPASEISQVLEQSLLDLVESLCLSLHGIQVESDHCQSLRVIGMLFKDLFSVLDRLLELPAVVERLWQG